MVYKYYDGLRDGDDNLLWIKAKFSIILKKNRRPKKVDAFNRVIAAGVITMFDFYARNADSPLGIKQFSILLKLL